jgi:hypothetical protein
MAITPEFFPDLKLCFMAKHLEVMRFPQLSTPTCVPPPSAFAS